MWMQPPTKRHILYFHTDNSFLKFHSHSHSWNFVPIPLSKLVAKIDTNGDSYLDREELVAWLIKVEETYEQKEVETEIEKTDTNKDGFITFEEIAENFEMDG